MSTLCFLAAASEGQRLAIPFARSSKPLEAVVLQALIQVVEVLPHFLCVFQTADEQWVFSMLTYL